ncbi:MAG: STAS domain-containing protein [Spirochaetales bacterium]|nr:STAS domain-containing protein [Spirochaetales bacterium]
MQPGSIKKTISLAGSYTIDRAGELARELSEALAHSPDLELDISGVVEFGLSALQILYAAASSAASHGGSLKLVGTAQASLCDNLVASGFAPTGPLSAGEFAARLPGFGKVAQ